MRKSGFSINVFSFLLVVALSFAVGGCARSGESVEITGSVPPSSLYHAEGEAISLLRVKNTDCSTARFWIGCSLRDELGRWHDVPACRVKLESGEESSTQRLDWTVPDEPPLPSGSYDVVVAVWSGKPGENKAERLTDATRKDAFRVAGLDEGFTSLDGTAGKNRPRSWDVVL